MKKKDHIIEVKAGRLLADEKPKKIDINEVTFYPYAKELIISMLDEQFKINFYTAYEENAEWFLGSEVEAVPEDKPKYIRTKGNLTLEDNLGDLPTYD
ncbi:DUF3892 domain-containing protein [Clostridium pasteurianum]|nr:DUF3892 domain-containing protein [Clostridium pasteurianum]